MVIAWILNFVARDILHSLLYPQDSASLVGGSSIQVQSEECTAYQGTMDINASFTQLRTLWDELQNFCPQPDCNCESSRTWAGYHHEDIVTQFLIGLMKATQLHEVKYS